MLKVTLSFNTYEEALAALKRLEGTAADPVKTPGKSAAGEKPAAIPPTAGRAGEGAPVKNTPDTAPVVSSTKEISFKEDIAPAFLALAKLPGGSQKQADLVKSFGVERLSLVDKARYGEVLTRIKELSS